MLITKTLGTRTIHAFVEIWRTEGIRGLWKGIGPNLFGVAPARALHFTTYNAAKRNLTLKFGDTSPVHFMAATLAGLTVITTTSPIWLVKTRMQLQIGSSGANYKNSLDCVRRVFREEGLRGFYKGLMASYIGISETAIQFMLYERFKLTVQMYKFKRQNDSMITTPKQISLSPTEYLTVASAAKLLASLMTYPHEVVRTRMREQRGTIDSPIKYTGFLHCIKLIVKEEGWRALYGGMGAHLVRVVPNAAIIFLTYETVAKMLSTGT